MKHHQHNLPAIYRITRISDGKVYIGQARRAHERLTAHQASLRRGNHRNGPLQQAWIEGEPEDFAWEIVCQPIDGKHDPETMTHLEVEVLKAYPDNFNLMVPVQAYLGAVDSTREKLSGLRKEMWADPEYKARLSEVQAKSMADPERKAKWKEGMDAFYATPEAAEIRREGGKKASKAWEERTEMREAESSRRKDLWKDPVYREKMIAARKAAWADPEKRAKRVASLKKAWAETPDDKRAARVAKASAWQRSEEGRESRREELQGRWDAGRGPARIKLTDDQRAAIKIDKRPVKIVAAEYGVSIGTVSRVRKS